MLRAPPTDIWRVGIVPAKITACQDPARLRALRHHITWLPDAGPWRYHANPFAVIRDGGLHIFVEAYDYRSRRAAIEHFEYGFNLEWRGRSIALSEPGHLTYPFVVEEDGAVFMVPGNSGADELVLYRALDFPLGWRREAVLIAGATTGEPSLVRHDGRWWLFFTTQEATSESELQVAFAPKLAGPWTLHPASPLRPGFPQARPGGTPFVGADGRIVLPLRQALTPAPVLRFLHFRELDPDRLVADPMHQRLASPLLSEAYPDGLNTLSACNGLTLLDVKRTEVRWWRHGINLQQRLAHWRGWVRRRLRTR